MCNTCGCHSTGQDTLAGKPFVFNNSQDTNKISLPDPMSAKEIRVAQDVLGSNDRIASQNRRMLDERNIFTLNLVGSPGSGKTTLIIKTIEALSPAMKIYVIEGDQYSSLDADRISNTQTPVIQINTGNGCHLDATNINRAINELNPATDSLLIIENVGNLVCPAMFDLGEHKRVVILSVTEGDDKPIKYAPMFHGSSACVINKTDLLAYVDFDLELAHTNLKKINHHLDVFPVSSTNGIGIPAWIDYIKSSIKTLRLNR